MGSGWPTRVISNIGVTPGFSTPEAELLKAAAAVDAGADIIADHTITEDSLEFIKTLIGSVNVPISTVPYYAAAVGARASRGSIASLQGADLLREVHAQAEVGVDIMTIHASFTLAMLKRLAVSSRVMPMTSRGGTWTAAAMLSQGVENPALTVFDDILDIVRESGVCLSLGPSLRPGTIVDGLDELVWAEIDLQAELAERCRRAGVPVVVEYGGHVRLDQVAHLVRTVRDKCRAPVRPLILATDIAVGWDHISSAIAGAQAVAAGADMLTVITRAEHIGLPRHQDIVEGVIATRIAAHVGDTVRNADVAADEIVSRARTACDWDVMTKSSLAPEFSAELYQELQRGSDKTDYCTMCGELCAHKILDEFFKTNGGTRP